MPTVTFIDLRGVSHIVHAEAGQSVMQVATDNMVPDIHTECGGSCVCASCHAYVDEAWIDRLPERQQLEDDMLSCVADLRPTSRLTCQIKLSPQLDGLVIHAAHNGY
jgi:2Fe-2S ferredoxin